VRLTSKSQYGLLVLAELVRSYTPTGAAYKQLSELSELINTSPKYLEQILLPLTHAGVVESKRGANGGYRLRIPPDKVSLAEVLRYLDGRIMPIPRWVEDAKESERAGNLSAFGDVIYQIRDSVRSILEETKLNVLAGNGDSAAEPGRIREEIETLNYYI
jgi:Rrf2 family protein